MSETKFTPGPWQTHISEVRGDLCVVSDRAWICGEILNRVRSIPEEEARANAHLIAAAPMLYRYLAEVRKWMDTDEFGPWEAAFCAEIDAVLAKARGEA